MLIIKPVHDQRLHRGTSTTIEVRVIKAKGDWATGRFGELPELDDEVRLCAFPTMTLAELHGLPVRVASRQPPRTVVVGKARS